MDRQESRCSAYNDAKLGGGEYILFADKGVSAMLLKDRPDLMRLLELVKTGRVRYIVIEAMDRLTRVFWDAMGIGQLLELYGVELHAWNLDRAVSKQELADEAKRAEADRDRRVEVTTDGLHDLIWNGGMPFACFGYEEGDRPGFPVICEEQAIAIRRVFELSLFMSGAKVAKQMMLEGFKSPKGTTEWDTWDVDSICNNQAYIGVVNYRTTDQETVRMKDPDHEPEPGEIAVKTIVFKKNAPRPANEWVWGINADRYQIVTDEMFVAVDRARQLRRRSRVRAEPGPTPVQDPFGNPICDCPGRSPSQSFYLHWHGGAPGYHCSQHYANGSCLSRVGQSRIAVADVQRVVLNGLRKHGLPLCESADYRADFLERVRMRSAVDDVNRASLEAECDALNAEIEGILADAIKSGFRPERIKGRVTILEEDLDQKNAEIARLPRFDPDSIDLEAVAASLSEAFAVIGERLPFKPQDKNEEDAAKRLQSMIGRVVVRRETMPVGRAEIEVALDVDGYVFGEEASSEDSWIVEREEVRGIRAFRRGEKMDAALDELAASGHYALTDAQWEMVRTFLPDMSKSWGKAKATMPTRAVADAAIFKFRTGIDLKRMPKLFGEAKAIRTLVMRFVRIGGMTEIVGILGAADPAWAEGLDVGESMPWSRREDPPWMFGDGAALAAKWAAERRFAVTEDQFQAIEHLIEPSVLQRRDHPRTLDGRQLIDGILFKLRTGIHWKRLPAPWGKGSDLWRAASALARSGGWGPIVAVWRERFPEIVDGLATDILDRAGAADTRRAEKYNAASKRGAANVRGIFENFGSILRAATGECAAVGLSGSRLRLPNHKYLRPDLVAGPAQGVVGAIFTRPEVVAQRSSALRHALYQKASQRFRAVRGVKHILVVCTDRVRVDHYEKKDGKWVSRALTEGDSIRIEHLNVEFRLREIYAGAAM
jgi:transposase